MKRLVIVSTEVSKFTASRPFRVVRLPTPRIPTETWDQRVREYDGVLRELVDAHGRRA